MSAARIWFALLFVMICPAPLIVAIVFGPLATLALFAALHVLGWCVRARAWLDDFARRDRARRERRNAAEDAQSIPVRSDEPGAIAVRRIRAALLMAPMLPFGVDVMGAMLLPFFAQLLAPRTAIALDVALLVGSMLVVVIYAVPMLAAQLSETETP